MKRNFAIKNSKGENIELTPFELHSARYLQREVDERFNNALGYGIQVDTLTKVLRKGQEQKYFEIFPADYFSVEVGEGAFASSLLSFRTFDIAGDWETGLINTGGQNDRLASADAGIDAVTVKIYNWAKSIGWSIFDVQQAFASGNFDVIEKKEQARKRNWDQGIQRLAFLGIRGQSNALGLLNQPGITTNTTLITKPIGTMTPGELKTFMGQIIEAFRSQVQRTSWPDRFVIPESDYNSLASQASPDFPIKSVLELLEESFKLITRNPGFRILPMPYSDMEYSGLDYQLYVLYNSTDVKMHIPVNYTSTLASSIDNFYFQNTAYGQASGVMAYRPLEVLYLTYTP